MKINLETAANRLKNAEDILIMTHRRPDGDTIGSGMGLHYALLSLGIRSRVECSDPLPKKFKYIYADYESSDFEPKFIVAVDAASSELLGNLKEKYFPDLQIDLCIDHHKSNELYAKETLLDIKSPATAEIIYLLITQMGVKLNHNISNALFTGLVTDTGCFKFPSVTSRTHRVAAELIDGGAEHGEINRINFENTSKGRLQVEALARNSLEYYFDDKCALLYLPDNLEETYGTTEEDLDGITSIPRMIEGVEIGLTIRSQGEGKYRISIRSYAPYDASRICSKFGGGGHLNAAGCNITGELKDVKQRLLAETELELRQENR